MNGFIDSLRLASYGLAMATVSLCALAQGDEIHGDPGRSGNTVCSCLIAQRVDVILSSTLQGDFSGRLLVFAKPVDPGVGAEPNDVDASVIRPADVAVAAREVVTFGSDRQATIDLDQAATPRPFSKLTAGDYWVQAVLDRNRDYARFGRGAGDVVSKVVTIRLPLEKAATIELRHEIPEHRLSDSSTLTPADRHRLSAARPYLTDVAVPSAALTRFWGRATSLHAWVLVPPNYQPHGSSRWPVVYLSGAYSANHEQNFDLATRIAELNQNASLPPMIWVFVDFSTQTGTTQFADSVNNGPWGQTMIGELIPALERQFAMDARPTGRFLIGHSSGGGASIWLQVRYPGVFGGAWATAPDPTDFHDFVGVDLYAANANMYHDSSGNLRPLVRMNGQVTATIRDYVALDDVLGTYGGVFRSYDWDFSPRGPDGAPIPMFNHVTGAIDPAVASYWREHFDTARQIEALSTSARRKLDGKLHVIVGTEDTFYLDGSVRRLKAVTEHAGITTEFNFLQGKNHNDLYGRDGDPWALLKDIARAMYAKARPEVTKR